METRNQGLEKRRGLLFFLKGLFFLQEGPFFLKAQRALFLVLKGACLLFFPCLFEAAAASATTLVKGECDGGLGRGHN